MRKATKATVLASAVFDLGILTVPAADAQTMPDRTPVPPVVEQPAPPARVVSNDFYMKWMKFDGFTWKYQGDRQAGIKSCLTQGGTPLEPVGKVSMQDITFCAMKK